MGMFSWCCKGCGQEIVEGEQEKNIEGMVYRFTGRKGRI